MPPTIAEVARWLRLEYPVAPGVSRVRWFNKAGGDHGHTTPKGTIYLNNAYSRQQQIETLIHEYAHCRVGWTDEPHTMQFWKEYGRLNNAYHAWRSDEDE